MKKQTAGRQRLGDFAPQFAALNDDVLFGQVWADPALSPKTRSIITCSALMAQGLFPQLESHIKLARQNGVTQAEMTALITQLAFYCGWAKAWSAFAIAEKIYQAG